MAFRGYLDTPYGRVAIESLGLEEDAARRIETTEDYTEFKLDRLGIPLADVYKRQRYTPHSSRYRMGKSSLGKLLRTMDCRICSFHI